MGDGHPRLTPFEIALEPDVEVNKLAHRIYRLLESMPDPRGPYRTAVSVGAAWLKLRGGAYGLDWRPAHDADKHLDNGSTINHVLYYAADQESLATVVFELFRSRGSKFLFEHGFDINYATNGDWKRALWALCVFEGDTGHDH